MKYRDKITFIQNKSILTLSESLTITKKDEDFPYNLLDNVMINSIYKNNSIELVIYNTSSMNIPTIPAEIEVVIDSKTYYIGILGSMDILAGKSIQLNVDGQLKDIAGKGVKVN